MRKLIILLILVLSINNLAAEEQEDAELKNLLLLQASTLPEAKLGYTYMFKFPFLQGEHPLTSNNNISLFLAAEISPISLNGLFSAVWTPIAFFELSAGGRIGSGWNIELFGGEIRGIGINKLNEIDNTAAVDGSAFDGLLWKAFGGGTIQFDLAAVVPGDWNHVVAQSYHEINYKGYTRASKNEAWYFESDDGENRNGFNYYGNLLIGYQMPIFFSLIGFLGEMDLYLYDTPGRSAWGDDLIRWTFSNILGFTITEQFEILLITQFRTHRNYKESNWKDLHFTARTLDTSSPLRFEFYRVAAAFAFKF